jgi:hypothetical protein
MFELRLTSRSSQLKRSPRLSGVYSLRPVVGRVRPTTLSTAMEPTAVHPPHASFETSPAPSTVEHRAGGACPYTAD